MSLARHRGSCHCGKVTFEVEAPARLEAYECNCSICAKVGFVHMIVPASRFRLLSGQENLVSYRFNTGAANHLFCETCGVKSFYVPRSHPDGYSVNLRCLNKNTVQAINVMPFDGANWEQNIEGLPALQIPHAA
jgi:hypothetical protein